MAHEGRERPRADDDARGHRSRAPAGTSSADRRHPSEMRWTIPIEAPIQAAPDNVGLDIDLVSRKRRAVRDISKKIFCLHAEARRDAVFEARPDRPTGTRC